ncbi:hypothetical protein [Tenacibaculum sp. 190524A05c]|uniref:hypothetical protein n=1 Tax=Tenacibaculum platacis TaxID=3137852 RepID=UPI0031FB55A4
MKLFPKLISKVSFLFVRNKVEDISVDRNFEWCIVGNIVDKHYYGMQKEIKRGTKQFGPGTKVYCLPEFGGMAHEDIVVLGKPRKQRKLIRLIMNTNRIKNFRLQKVYKPKLILEIRNHFYYQYNKSTTSEYNSLTEMVKYLNTLTEELKN